MNEAGTDAASRLWWVGRRLSPLVVVLVAAGAALGASQVPSVLGDGDEPIYEARAVVLATQLELEPELLPKTAVAIFESGRVAAAVTRTADVDVPQDEVVPDVVDIEPVENSVALQVLGRHTDPDTAAGLANVAASTLVSELNRPGDLFGRFIVQQRAMPPSQPEDHLGPAAGAVIGTAAALAFALGIIGLYVAMRRPVLTPSETSAITGAPVLGTPRLPRKGHVDPLRVAGLAALSKRIFPDRRETAVIVGVPGDRGERSSIALLLARVLGRSGPVQLVSDQDLPPDVGDEERRNIHRATVHEVDQRADGTPAVVEGPTAEDFDLPQFLPADAKVVLVVREGTPMRALEEVAAQFLPGELLGVLFVPSSRGRRSSSDQRAPARKPGSSPSRTGEPDGGGRPEDRGADRSALAHRTSVAAPEGSEVADAPRPDAADSVAAPPDPVVLLLNRHEEQGRSSSSRRSEDSGAFRDWATDRPDQPGAGPYAPAAGPAHEEPDPQDVAEPGETDRTDGTEDAEESQEGTPHPDPSHGRKVPASLEVADRDGGQAESRHAREDRHSHRSVDWRKSGGP